MIEMQRELVTAAPPRSAFDYFADFTTSEEWDPGSIRTVRVSGDGGVGSRYANTSKIAGRTNDVDYEVISLVPGRSIELRGENSSLITHDTITVEPHPHGSLVTYRLEFTFQGWRRYAERVLRRAVSKLANNGADGLRRELDRLEA
ncbi:SRPBCC family protein [Mycolicibacterium bacteremicum]|uniref:Polyketide cyclase n=2 Tax=Mycolicibacterium bacteremicum TaxID=564198 RepID=A0A1W9YP61_MYCBA|nr:SRPBCC family protein [Mycolicibacterium bacteremicum]ORA01789.1 polyketide cyclase [Mycolicibacterium bacteremicum]